MEMSLMCILSAEAKWQKISRRTLPKSMAAIERRSNSTASFALIALRERPCYSAAASKAKHMLMAAPRGVDLAVAHIYRNVTSA
eukprot:scaffold93445_cov13-Tisochrysis_lutea.AAC.1